jgi:hypothetical protein
VEEWSKLESQEERLAVNAANQRNQDENGAGYDEAAARVKQAKGTKRVTKQVVRKSKEV